MRSLRKISWKRFSLHNYTIFSFNKKTQIIIFFKCLKCTKNFWKIVSYFQATNKHLFFSSVRLHVKKLLRVLCLDTCYHKYQRTLARLLDKRYYFFRNIAIVFGLFYQMRVCHCQGELCVYFSIFFVGGCFWRI